jgi:hypothetical protein
MEALPTIIWIIIIVIFLAKRLQKQAAEQREEQEQTGPSPQPEYRAQEQRASSEQSPAEDLLANLRDAFGETVGDVGKAIKKDLPGAPVAKPSKPRESRSLAQQETRVEKAARKDREKFRKTKLEKAGEKPVQKVGTERKERTARERETRRRRLVSRPRPAASAPALTASEFSRVPISELRKAIVWTEILGTPVGLKDRPAEG